MAKMESFLCFELQVDLGQAKWWKEGILEEGRKKNQECIQCA